MTVVHSTQNYGLAYGERQTDNGELFLSLTSKALGSLSGTIIIL